MREKIVAGNWKMNKGIDDGLKLVDEISKLLYKQPVEEVTVIIAPPFISLFTIADMLYEGEPLKFAAQNCHSEKNGAFTGEVSAGMIADTGAEYVIIGHSERRQYFGETNEILKKKVQLAIEAGLKPIFCIGETLEERNEGRHFETVKNQLTEGVFDLSKEEFKDVVIAYEPVWAIGTGVTATPAQAQEMHSYIRSQIKKKYAKEISDNTPILYGGSCNPKNAEDLFALHDVDGGLIGGASLKAEDFVEIIHSF